MLGRLHGLSPRLARTRADELLEAFGLADAATRLVKTYSGGMRRRLDIGATIVATPDLVFVDEPTTGLDPRYRNQVWDIVRALVAAGTTVMLTTQYLEEADRLADRIAIVDRGRKIAEGTAGELIEKGIFDRFRSMPVWGPAALVGALLGDTIRYSLAAIITVALGLALGFRPGGGAIGVLLAVGLLLVFSFSLSWIWTAVGLRMQTPENVMQASMMILFPLTMRLYRAER